MKVEALPYSEAHIRPAESRRTASDVDIADPTIQAFIVQLWRDRDASVLEATEVLADYSADIVVGLRHRQQSGAGRRDPCHSAVAAALS
jgi:hypothetical protein